MSVLPRVRRLFGADGRCFDVAVDHGFFGEPRFLGGIEDLSSALDAVVEAGPDAIQLSPGAAPLLQERPRPKPALVMRTDVANVYGPQVDDEAAYCTATTTAVGRCSVSVRCSNMMGAHLGATVRAAQARRGPAWRTRPGSRPCASRRACR